MKVILMCAVMALTVAALTTAEPAAQDHPKGKAADNELCLGCHDTYTEEKLTADHGATGIGCQRCHGSSEAHVEDADKQTAPDKMYVDGFEINSYCMKCHPSGLLAKKPVHKMVLADEEGEKFNCMKCHGKKHKLAKRTIKWDKETGEVVK